MTKHGGQSLSHGIINSNISVAAALGCSRTFEKLTYTGQQFRFVFAARREPSDLKRAGCLPRTGARASLRPAGSNHDPPVNGSV